MYKVEILPSAMQDIKGVSGVVTTRRRVDWEGDLQEKIREKCIETQQKILPFWAIRYDDVHTAVSYNIPFL